MSKPRTHYAMPMTMGRSICPVGKPWVIKGLGTRIHGSTVELVCEIEEVTCMLCHRAYWHEGPPLERPKRGDTAVCVVCWTRDGHRDYCPNGPYPDGPPVDGDGSVDGFGDDVEDAEDEGE